MQGGTILFVTANRDVWQPIVSTLEEFGFEVLVPETEVSAAMVLGESPVDCVVCDATIEGPALIGFVDSVRDTDKRVPILLLGDPDDWQPVLTAMERGATTHLASQDHDFLISEIRQAVNHHAVETHRAAMNALKAASRRITTRLVSAENRQQCNARMYEALTASDLYQVVYVGQFDQESRHLLHTHPLPGSLNLADFEPQVDATTNGLLEHAHSTQEINVARGHATTGSNTQPTHESGSRDPIRAASLAVVPLVYRESNQGLILLGTNRDQAFDSTELKLLDEIRKVGGAMIALIESRNQQRDIDEFTEDLLHELRNPLAIAKAHLSLAWEEDNPDAHRRVDAALDRIDRIIETVGTAQLDVVEQTTSRDLGATAEDGWTSVKTDDAELEIVNSRSLEADHDLLERLFANLFRNAITHGGSDAIVQVGMTETGFYVEDDGPGIPREHWDRVFDRGFSLGNGLGIGLDIVKRIVKAHDWEIEVKAGEQGGARFEVSSVDTEPWNWNDTPVR